jgi:hypothetical protein
MTRGFSVWIMSNFCAVAFITFKFSTKIRKISIRAQTHRRPRHCERRGTSREATITPAGGNVINIKINYIFADKITNFPANSRHFRLNGQIFFAYSKFFPTFAVDCLVVELFNCLIV